MYPLVRLVTGLLFVACFLEFGITQATVKWLFFYLFDHHFDRDRPARAPASGRDQLARICRRGNLLGVCAPNDGAAFLLCLRLFHWVPPERVLGVIKAFLGAAFGSLMLWGAAALYKLVRGREGMGMGDVKMMAMAGAFLGIRNAFLMILLGTLLGSILGIAVIAMMYVRGAGRQLAERASRRGLGTVNRFAG